MKIIIVGATGTIGKVVAAELGKRHEIIGVSAHNSPVKVDITSAASIAAMFKAVGPFDALVSASGGGYWGSFEKMTEEDFYLGIKSKMMGQINLVLEGRKYIRPNGSFTLTTGILAEDPVKDSCNLAVVNAAVNAFAVSAAMELGNGVRINAVSPGVVADSREKFGPIFPGHVPVSMERVVAGFVKSVEGMVTGQVIKVY